MNKKKVDLLKEFRCKKCKSINCYVKKGTDDFKIRCCRRCGYEESIPIPNTRSKK